MIIPKTWGEWLTNNADAETLDKNTNLVISAARTATNSEKYIELLHENNGVAMMTKPAMGNNLQFSFQYIHHGSSLLPQQKSLITITGFDQGTPIEIDPKHLYKSTTKTDTPFGAIHSTTDPQQLSALTATSDNRVKFKSSVLLTPFLVGGLVEETDFKFKVNLC